MRVMRDARQRRAGWLRTSYRSWAARIGVGVCTVAACAGFASGASASTGGNFIATGHDMDYHCSAGQSPECSYLKIAVDKVRNGSSLPILALDQGGSPTCTYYYGYGWYCYGGAELITSLGDAGYASGDIVHVNPTSAQWASMPLVDSSGKPLYSAIVTASDSSCGGCDNNSAGETAINNRSSDIATYFNAGGGILALSGAGNAGTYYNFVPLHVSGGYTSPPYTVTSDGAAIGVTYNMANCCATHNSFNSVPSGLVALETDSRGIAETLAAFNATITTGGGGDGGGGGFTGGGTPPETSITVTGQPVSATEGQSFSGSVATVSGDSDSTASDYTVSIDWGDGSTSSGSVDSSGNVTGSHTYSEEGSHTVKTTVTDADETSNTGSDSSTATVADASLTAGQLSAAGGTEGTGGGSASFSFTDANPNAAASEFTATVDWGDGSSSGGTVTKNADGSFSVSAPGHTYAEEGKDTVKVSVTDAGGSTTSASQDVTVADAALSASGKTINSQPSFGGKVASFTDANPNGSVGDFTASIDWGDGSSSAGTVSQNGGGFDVSGSHTYAQTGPYTVKVHVADKGGSTADATTQVLVYQFAASNGGSFAIGDKNAAVGSQVTFWGAQWAGQNSLSGGSAPAAFKGFGDTPSSNPPACGGSYSTAPGNSSTPPATLPAYMAVYVSSGVSKQGSKITGDIKHIVIVKTDAGYQSDPGHPGTGKVVATVC